jgi:hypothetical protein
MWRQKFQSSISRTQGLPPPKKNKIVERFWTSKFKPTHKEQEQELPQTGLIPQEDHMSRFSYDWKQNLHKFLLELWLPAIIPWQFVLSQATSFEIIHSATATKRLQAKLLATKTLCLLQPSSSLLNTWDTRRRHMRLHCEVKKKPCATSHPKPNSFNTKTPKFSLL